MILEGRLLASDVFYFSQNGVTLCPLQRLIEGEVMRTANITILIPMCRFACEMILSSSMTDGFQLVVSCFCCFVCDLRNFSHTTEVVLQQVDCCFDDK